MHLRLQIPGFARDEGGAGREGARSGRAVEEEAQRAVKERPNYPRALLTLANLYAGVRQWREAVRWLQRAAHQHAIAEKAVHHLHHAAAVEDQLIAGVEPAVLEHAQ